MTLKNLAMAAVLVALPAASPADTASTPSAAGRLERIPGQPFCSAALIAPQIVLTAAHCVPKHLEEKDKISLRFRPGGARKNGGLAVDKVAVHPLYLLFALPEALRLRFDMALARLTDPRAAAGIEPLPVGPEAVVGETLYVVSWRTGLRPRQRACKVIEGIEGLVTLACEVRPGESGAPVLRKQADGSLELVAVISSRTSVLNQPVAQASNVAGRLEPLEQALEAAARHP